MMDDRSSTKLVDGRRKSLLEERKTLTGKISDSVRFLGFGLLASFYAIYTDRQKFGELLSEPGFPRYAILVVGFCGALSILLDYLQYVAGASSVGHAMARDDQAYDPSHYAYRARSVLYVAKQVPIVFGCIALIFFVLTI